MSKTILWVCSLLLVLILSHDHDQRVNGCPCHQSSHQRLDSVKKIESFDPEEASSFMGKEWSG